MAKTKSTKPKQSSVKRGGRGNYAPAAPSSSPTRLDDATTEFFAAQGRRGGKSKSDAKIAASLANVEKANEARWGKSYAGKIAKRFRPKGTR